MSENIAEKLHKIQDIYEKLPKIAENIEIL